MHTPTPPEILAPAGDEAAMWAAVHAGADAVYFGLQGHNARARATNFDAATLPRVMASLHAWGVKGFVTLNTLAFDDELPALEAAIRACADAGVDAVIVQDVGVVALVRAIAPTLEVHASTQMTCTDAASARFAQGLGATRVVLARELSLDDIRAVRAGTDVELEVFVHGALCVSYSGQCLTSEAIGGRSANRGACAQACRLPYDLVVDGRVRPLGDVAHLLSPEDLDAVDQIDALKEIGVATLKIEGRLKGPAYAAATTRLYRAAVDGDVDDATRAARRRAAHLTYSRGSGPGFFLGVDHQRLVDGTTCDHRGLAQGVVVDVYPIANKRILVVAGSSGLVRGDGIVVLGGKGGHGEVGGRIWEVVDDEEHSDRVHLWLGPDVDVGAVVVGRRVFQNDAPKVDKQILKDVDDAPAKDAVDVVVRGAVGGVLVVDAVTAAGLVAHVESDVVVEVARTQPTSVATLRDKLGALGDTPWLLRTLTSELPADASVPLSALKRVRRAVEEQLHAAAARRHTTTQASSSTLLAAAALPSTSAAPAGLFVLCRTLEQAHAALDAGADGVWLDFLAMQGVSVAVAELRARTTPAFVGVAPPRIRKPGEEKITKFLLGLGPDGVLVRGLGQVHEIETGSSTSTSKAPLYVGDFSLNVTNRLSAKRFLDAGLAALTPAFDLDEAQLTALLAGGLGPHTELVVHHPMPLFHTEHCVFARLLSSGTSFRDCGRPCESHVIALRDRAGVDNPVEADIGCRNTVFHGHAQSAAHLVERAAAAGVGRFRIELVRESAVDVARIVDAYRQLLAGRASAKETVRALRTEAGYGVVKGSLRVLA